MDLQFLKILTGIATQGAISKETQKSYYVTNFKLEVSTNGEDWMVYRHGKNHKVGGASGGSWMYVEHDKMFAFLANNILRLAATVPEPESRSHELGKWAMRGRER